VEHGTSQVAVVAECREQVMQAPLEQADMEVAEQVELARRAALLEHRAPVVVVVVVLITEAEQHTILQVRVDPVSSSFATSSRP